MNIALIAAMQKELKLILSQLESYETITIKDALGSFDVYVGRIGEHSVLLAQCGIGKVNSALRTHSIIEYFHPALVINSGVAGGVDESMKIGSVLVAERIAYHDVWCGPGTEYGQADGCPLFFTSDEKAVRLLHEMSDSADDHFRFGLICSGDQFISRAEEVRKIKSAFPEALGCDMESASIAQTCYKAGVPCVVVRVMSDMPGGDDNISQYQNFWNDAPKRTFEVVFSLIRNL